MSFVAALLLATFFGRSFNGWVKLVLELPGSLQFWAYGSWVSCQEGLAHLL